MSSEVTGDSMSKQLLIWHSRPLFVCEAAFGVPVVPPVKMFRTTSSPLRSSGRNLLPAAGARSSSLSSMSCAPESLHRLSPCSAKLSAHTRNSASTHFDRCPSSGRLSL